MEKLTYLETLEVERQEKINAKKKALLQDNQRQKRLRYLPRIAEKIILIVFLSGMYFLIYAVWFVAGETTRKEQVFSCPITHCPVKECLVTALPETGAN